MITSIWLKNLVDRNIASHQEKLRDEGRAEGTAEGIAKVLADYSTKTRAKKWNESSASTDAQKTRKEEPTCQYSSAST